MQNPRLNFTGTKEDENVIKKQQFKWKRACFEHPFYPKCHMQYIDCIALISAINKIKTEKIFHKPFSVRRKLSISSATFMKCKALAWILKHRGTKQ